MRDSTSVQHLDLWINKGVGEIFRPASAAPLLGKRLARRKMVSGNNCAPLALISSRRVR